MIAPKVEFKYTSGVPKKLRKSERFTLAMAQVNGRKYTVKTTLVVESESKKA